MTLELLNSLPEGILERLVPLIILLVKGHNAFLTVVFSSLFPLFSLSPLPKMNCRVVLPSVMRLRQSIPTSCMLLRWSQS